jgi:hypothetical protein
MSKVDRSRLVDSLDAGVNPFCFKLWPRNLMNLPHLRLSIKPRISKSLMQRMAVLSLLTRDLLSQTCQ